MTIARAIEEDLVARIRAGEQPPYPLNLAGIASHFGVSVMPARVAVETLVDNRYLIRQPNGRLAINPRRRAVRKRKSAASRQPAQSPDQVLSDHVVRLSLNSDTSYLREEATAEQFGIGRTVVRRVLSRLAGAGIIRHEPRCGWRVQPYREKDMLDYLDMREMLELHAVDLAWDRLEQDSLKAMLAANSPDAAGRPRLDNTLHAYWIGLADNRYISAFFDQHGVYHEALFEYAALAASIVEEMAAQHRAILEAMIVRRRTRAKQALSVHIRGQRPNVSKMFECLTQSSATQNATR
ncbi:MAG: GntR family transcriptional regulator [Planctomycetota bacterium]